MTLSSMEEIYDTRNFYVKFIEAIIYKHLTRLNRQL